MALNFKYCQFYCVLGNGVLDITAVLASVESYSVLSLFCPIWKYYMRQLILLIG